MDLLPEQVALLRLLVDTERRGGRDTPFLLVEDSSGPYTVRRNGAVVSKVITADMDTLGRLGFIMKGPGGRSRGYSFNLSPEAHTYVNELDQRAAEAGDRIEESIRWYLRLDSFRSRFPAAYAKWAEAEKLLLSQDSTEALTTMGHLCREAVQQFALALCTEFQPPGAESLKIGQTKARLKAVVECQSDALREDPAELLKAVIDYWDAVIKVLDRQEHGGQREGAPLLHEDGRRAVFHTATVMYELARLLKR